MVIELIKYRLLEYYLDESDIDKIEDLDKVIHDFISLNKMSIKSKKMISELVTYIKIVNDASIIDI